MVKWEELGIWCGVIALMLVFIALLITFLPVQNNFIETQYEVIYFSCLDVFFFVHVYHLRIII